MEQAVCCTKLEDGYASVCVSHTAVTFLVMSANHFLYLKSKRVEGERHGCQSLPNNQPLPSQKQVSRGRASWLSINCPTISPFHLKSRRVVGYHRYLNHCPTISPLNLKRKRVEGEQHGCQSLPNNQHMHLKSRPIKEAKLLHEHTLSKKALRLWVHH